MVSFMVSIDHFYRFTGTLRERYRVFTTTYRSVSNYDRLKGYGDRNIYNLIPTNLLNTNISLLIHSRWTPTTRKCNLLKRNPMSRFQTFQDLLQHDTFIFIHPFRPTLSNTIFFSIQNYTLTFTICLTHTGKCITTIRIAFNKVDLPAETQPMIANEIAF